MKLIKTTDHRLMKFTNLDAVAGNVLAEMLEIEHSKMIRTIKRVIKSEKIRKEDTPKVASHNLLFGAIFKEWEYTSKQNKKLKTYIMNEDALYLVVSNSQSAKAHELKVWFKSEFNKMRIERNERLSSKALQRPITDSLKELYLRLHNAGSTQNETLLYMTFNKKCFKAVTGLKYHKDLLDTLDAEQACNLAELRDNAHKQLDYMLEGDEIPQKMRANLWAFIKGFTT